VFTVRQATPASCLEYDVNHKLTTIVGRADAPTPDVHAWGEMRSLVPNDFLCEACGGYGVVEPLAAQTTCLTCDGTGLRPDVTPQDDQAAVKPQRATSGWPWNLSGIDVFLMRGDRDASQSSTAGREAGSLPPLIGRRDLGLADTPPTLADQAVSARSPGIHRHVDVSSRSASPKRRRM
jgi:hypothetical protein